jgi:peptide/nickel transport system permease protein
LTGYTRKHAVALLKHPRRSLMTVAPWLAVFPSLAVILLIVAFNLMGDALRDLLDPRRRTASAQVAGL